MVDYVVLSRLSMPFGSSCIGPCRISMVLLFPSCSHLEAPQRRVVRLNARCGRAAMSDPRTGWADRLVRWTTTVSDGGAGRDRRDYLLQAYVRARSPVRGDLLDGGAVAGVGGRDDRGILDVAAGLLKARQRSGVLPWVLLVIGSAASLSANVAVAEPSAVGRLIAAWPSAALTALRHTTPKSRGGSHRKAHTKFRPRTPGSRNQLPDSNGPRRGCSVMPVGSASGFAAFGP